MIKPVFNILSVTQQDNTVSAVLALDPSSQVFAGHFPDQPVVPGACMVQLVKDVLESHLKATVRLIKADNIKFLGLLVPDSNDLLLNITYLKTGDIMKVNANLLKQDVICMKFAGTFK